MQINAIWQKKTTDFSIYNIFKDNLRHINATKMISDACEKDIFAIPALLMYVVGNICSITDFDG